MFLGEVFNYLGARIQATCVDFNNEIVETNRGIYPMKDCTFRVYDSTYDYRDLDYKGFSLACSDNFVGKIAEYEIVIIVPVFIYKSLLNFIVIDEYSFAFTSIVFSLINNTFNYAFLDNNKFIVCFGEGHSIGCFPLKRDSVLFEKEVLKYRLFSRQFLR